MLIMNLQNIFGGHTYFRNYGLLKIARFTDTECVIGHRVRQILPTHCVKLRRPVFNLYSIKSDE